jgi:hypothetical protein
LTHGGSIGLTISQEQAARIMSVDQAAMNELAARFDALSSGILR